MSDGHDYEMGHHAPWCAKCDDDAARRRAERRQAARVNPGSAVLHFLREHPAGGASVLGWTADEIGRELELATARVREQLRLLAFTGAVAHAAVQNRRGARLWHATVG